MKIAVTAMGKEMEAQVDPRFGRAACFVIVDTDSGQFEAVDNTNVAASGGAGIHRAEGETVVVAQAGVLVRAFCGSLAKSLVGVRSHGRLW